MVQRYGWDVDVQDTFGGNAHFHGRGNEICNELGAVAKVGQFLAAVHQGNRNAGDALNGAFQRGADRAGVDHVRTQVGAVVNAGNH